MAHYKILNAKIVLTPMTGLLLKYCKCSCKLCELAVGQHNALPLLNYRPISVIFYIISNIFRMHYGIHFYNLGGQYINTYTIE